MKFIREKLKYESKECPICDSTNVKKLKKWHIFWGGIFLDSVIFCNNCTADIYDGTIGISFRRHK